MSQKFWFKEKIGTWTSPNPSTCHVFVVSNQAIIILILTKNKRIQIHFIVDILNQKTKNKEES